MMTDFSPLLNLPLLILVGFFARRFNLLKDEHVDAITAMLLNIAYPALILNSVTSVDIDDLAKESIIVIVSTLFITSALFFLAIVVLKKYKNYDRKSIIVFNLAIGNVTYVALPVIKALFSDLGVYYAVIHATAQDILIWTLFYGYFHSNEGKNKFNIKRFISPCTIALFVSIVLSMLKFRFIGAFDNVLNQLSGLTIPLALIYIGVVLGSCSDMRIWIPDKDTIVLSVIKVVFIPMAVYIFMLVIPTSEYLRLLMALVFSAPATLMSTVWAKQFNFDYEFSIKMLFFSTILFLLVMIPFFKIIDVN